MKKWILFFSLALTACGGGPSMLDGLTDTGSVSSSQGAVNLHRIPSNRTAYDYGYSLTRVTGSARTVKQNKLVNSYINGLDDRIEELEIRRRAIYSGAGFELNDIFGKKNRKINEIQSEMRKSKLRNVENKLYLAKKLIVESKGMLQN